MKTKSYFSNPKMDALLKKADVVVFDFNGTLLDDEPVLLEAWNSSIEEWHKVHKPDVTCPHIDEASYAEFCLGVQTKDWMPTILGRPLEEGELDAVRKRKDEIYIQTMSEKAHEIVRPGVLELIGFLSDAGVPMALATSARWAILEPALGKKGLNVASRFEIIVCGDMVEKKKPHPEVYEKIKAYFTKASGTTPRLLAIEDSETGVESAKRADADCLAIPNRFTRSQDLSAADAIIDTLLPNAAFVSPVLPTPDVDAEKLITTFRPQG